MLKIVKNRKKVVSDGYPCKSFISELKLFTYEEKRLHFRSKESQSICRRTF